MELTPYENPENSLTLVPVDQQVFDKSESILHQALEERHLTLHIESIQSSKDILGISPNSIVGLEKLILQIYEDGDEDLRLLTVRDVNGKPVGFIFWRNLPEDEMVDWIKECYQKTRSTDRKICNKKVKKEMRDKVKVLSLSTEIARENIETVGWTKIELMCVSESMQGQHIGTILLAAALFYSYFQESKTHAILQVAGGKSNTRAIELYKKFQFGWGEKYFEIPNDNIMVLWEIEKMIQHFAWNDFKLSSHEKKLVLTDK